MATKVAKQAELLARENEILELKQKLKACMHKVASVRSHSSESVSDHDDGPPELPVRRSGIAPPVGMFMGEDPEVRFEDWLPSLQLATHWNGWSPDEQLVQLAGHGCACQEWILRGDAVKQ